MTEYERAWPYPSRPFYTYPPSWYTFTMTFDLSEEAQETSDGCAEAPAPHQPRDAVQFKLGTCPIEIDVIRNAETGMSTIIVDRIPVAEVSGYIEEDVYRAVREAARRIGQRTE